MPSESCWKSNVAFAGAYSHRHDTWPASPWYLSSASRARCHPGARGSAQRLGPTQRPSRQAQSTERIRRSMAWKSRSNLTLNSINWLAAMLSSGNHSMTLAQAEPYSWPPGPVWRPAVVARLARNLRYKLVDLNDRCLEIWLSASSLKRSFENDPKPCQPALGFTRSLGQKCSATQDQE